VRNRAHGGGMSLIANCIDKLVKIGKIDAAIGERAKVMQGEATARMGETLPGSDASALAALEVARVMAEYASSRRYAIAQQAIKENSAMERLASHPHSKAAAGMALLSKDIRQRAGGPNVFSHAEVIEGELLKPLTPVLEKYAAGVGERLKGLAGMTDTTSARNIIRELRGVETGDVNAKAFADGWRKSNDVAVKEAKRVGYTFNEKADWITPQFWAQGRLRALGPEQFVADVMQEVEGGGLKVMKPDGTLAGLTEVEAIARQAAESIATGAEATGGGAFASQFRTFNFTQDAAGAEAWIRLQERFGGGQDIVAMLRGHVNRQARSIALADIMGPQHGSTAAAVRDAIKAEEAAGALSRLNPVRLFESSNAFDRAYKVASGQADSLESEVVAGIFGGLRNIHVAANMGSAIVSGVFSDPVTLAMTASHNGMGGGQVIARALRDLAADSPAVRAEIASQMNLVAHSVSDLASGGARFAEELVDKSVTNRLADIVIRAQGLEAWTSAIKRAFTMEFMGYAARQQDLEWGALDEPFRNFLTRYGFTPDDWAVLRAAEPVRVDGARFFDHTSVADQALGRRLMGAILDERGYAVLEPDTRTRSFTTMGLQRGNIAGELIRSVMLYKSFSMSMILTHGMRAGQLVAEGNRMGAVQAVGAAAAYAVPMLVSLTLGGALALQARQMLTGKDPQDMTRWDFWGRAFAQGGGAGIYGDLINSAVTRSNQSLVATLAGPVGSLVDTAGKLTFGNLAQMSEGRKTSAGKELVDGMKRFVPGSSLWYARLGVDRMIYDSIQMQIDPDYLASWGRERGRLQKDFGQGFYWDRGQWGPARAPDLSAAMGR
jgi:hypothetical protein